MTAESDKLLAQLIGLGDDSSHKSYYPLLQEKTDYLNSVLNSISAILICVDITTQITLMNQRAESKCGILQQESAGKSVFALFPELGSQKKEIEDVIHSGQSHKGLRVFPPHGEQEPHYELTITPLMLGPTIRGAVILMDDISHNVRLQEMIIQTEKMLSVGGLAAGMAHEINNPLSAIVQNAQLVQSRTGTNLEKNHSVAKACGTDMGVIASYLKERNVYEFLDAIIGSGRRAAKIVSNMLSFVRKPPGDTSVQNIKEILEEVLTLASSDYNLKKKYDFRQIQIVREYESVPLVPCDKSKIQQVFLNILQNGAYAMATNPNRDPNTSSQFTFRIKPSSIGVCIEISDNGPGMDNGTRSRIFEPFYTTKEPGDGTGLGLFIAYFIITDNHGGTISVISEPGYGSTFSIQLPVSAS